MFSNPVTSPVTVVGGGGEAVVSEGMSACRIQTHYALNCDNDLRKRTIIGISTMFLGDMVTKGSMILQAMNSGPTLSLGYHAVI